MAKPSLRRRVTHQLIRRLADHEHGFRRRTLRLLILGAAVYVGYMFCVGDYGLLRIYRLIQERDAQMMHYYRVTAEATDYAYRLRRLQTDPHFVEWLARTRYGYSRPQETIYRLKFPAAK